MKTMLKLLGAAALLLSIWVVKEQTEAALSTGLYIDNGLDQTVFDPFVDEFEKEEMEDEMLTLLG